MIDETSLAFELPHQRAIATSGGDPLDRISVRDYTREVEIGAFQAERGVTQHIRFNVVLEVSRNAAAQSDDVDQVLSYDTITEAIEQQLSTERINLLETLAERIAERVLENPKSVRIFVRIEKLDRIPGTLGVEIARSRITADNVIASVVEPTAPSEPAAQPLVVFLPNAVLYSDHLESWLNVLADHEPPAIICLDHAPEAAPDAKNPAANRRISLLNIEQNTWVLAAKDKRCVVVDSRTELDWAIKNDQLSVWAPSRIVLDALNGPVDHTAGPLALAAWFADDLGADTLVVIEGAGAAPSRGAWRTVTRPVDLDPPA